ncbi:MAG: hypothetical protein P4L53_23120 [Candidatus Obscuribacterales bacterium]|nr:hypothetical protein [Candidatus Obscuribacterales bacterium]
MNFRSSTYMPDSSLDTNTMTWCEAHQAIDGTYLVITIVGNPDKVVRPNFLSRCFVKRPARFPSTLPANYVFSLPAPDVYDALRQIFDWEKHQCTKGSKIVDIGDVRAKRFGGIEHYVNYVSCGRLVGPAYPIEVREAVSAFINGLGVRYLLGVVSRPMYEAAVNMGPLFAKLPTSLTSTKRSD